MRSRRNSSQPVDGTPAVVTAGTLKEAYKTVREQYGEDAVILGTRTVNRRHELGLGHERQVEVTVQLPGAAPTPAPAALGHRQATGTLDRLLSGQQVAGITTDIGADIAREVERIEDLVAAIDEAHTQLAFHSETIANNALAETLLENGASPDAVNTLLTRFTSETGAAVHDRPAAMTWLTENLRASNCTWDDLYGCHAFLGEAGSGRSDLVLTAAGLLQALGRRTLVLSMMPGNNGDIRRLQIEAASKGFDAAVIKKEVQLAATEKHLTAYDVVLVDMPHLGHDTMAEGGVVHAWLARNTRFHRHLLVPMDKDPRDMDTLNQAARAWNCDWIAVSRTDLTKRPAKLLDLLERVPLPVSLTSSDPARTGHLEIAHSERILDTILGGDPAPEFEPGLAATAASQTAEVAW